MVLLRQWLYPWIYTGSIDSEYDGRHGGAETGKKIWIKDGRTVNVALMLEWASRFESVKGNHNNLHESNFEGEPDDPGIQPGGQGFS